MDLKLGDKCALVTGSFRGTGAVIAKALAAEGTSVLIHGPTDDDTAALVEDIVAGGGKAKSTSGDILSDAGAEELFGLIAEGSDTVDILVNNFGRADPATWGNPGTEDWHKALNVNLLSSVRLAKLFTPTMKDKGWGRVIQLGTIGTTRPNAQMPGYYAAKAALATTTVSLAKELKRTGITVNHVSPGLIKTPEVEESFLAYAQKKKWGDTWQEVEEQVTEKFMPNPTGRISSREDIADLVTFLASPRASHINGQNIRIDGGAVDFTA
jgi:3-oxoacyl-[acyl-carrier protein] reductase